MQHLAKATEGKKSGHRLFTKIMVIVSVAILVVSIVLSGAYVSIGRKRQINLRLQELTDDAREIAYLSAQNGVDVFSFFSGRDSVVREYIQWKAGKVYQKYGAIIFVADRSGRILSNIASAITENPEFAASISGKELRDAMAKVLSGEEINVKTVVDGAPTFTVGVPYVQDGNVLGAVLIQTQAQHIEGKIAEAVLTAAVASVCVGALASAAIYMLLRRALKPLKKLTEAAERMAEGDFSTRAENMPEENSLVRASTPEVDALTAAFNKMAEKLEQTENSRKEFVANVSHELRSPITSISGYIQGMTDGTIPPEDHGKYMEIVKAETARLTKLIGDLLALSRLEKDDVQLNITQFDINELLRQVAIRRMNDIDGKNIELQCNFATDPCMVEADQDRIEQVAVNLLDNAIKFTPDNGKISLKTSDETAEKICRITVEDNGIGILPEDRDKVFDRFFTCDRAHTSGKGTGLGLSICQRICEMHGQSICLSESDENRTAFTFTLKTAEIVKGSENK